MPVTGSPGTFAAFLAARGLTFAQVEASGEEAALRDLYFGEQGFDPVDVPISLWDAYKEEWRRDLSALAGAAPKVGQAALLIAAVVAGLLFLVILAK